MENPSIVSHVSIGCSDLEKAKDFYDKIFATLGAKRVMEHPGAVAYGKKYPEFWIGKPLNGQAPTPGNGVHFGFVADSKEQVHEFYKVALEAGGKDNGAPGPRPEYGEPYYGCFVFDLDQNKIEAAFWDESLEG